MAPPIHKACSTVRDGCSQERSHSKFCRSKFQKEQIFKEPMAKGKFTPFYERKKEPKGHRTRCSASWIITGVMPIKMTTSNQIPSDSMGILSVCKHYMEERARGWQNSPSHALGIDTGSNPLKGQSPQARRKNFKTAKPRILIPTLWPILWKTIIQNDTGTSTFTAVVPPTTKTQTQDKGQWQIKASTIQMYKGCYSDLKNCHWNNEIRPTVPTRMDYGGPHTKRNQQQRKKIADDTPGGQNSKKERQRR